MGLSIIEQETIINIMRDSREAEIYTSDTLVMARLDKLAAREDAPEWRIVEEIHAQNGDLVAKRYRTDKRLVSFRAARQTRELTDEQRKELAERLRLACHAGKA